MNDKMHDSIGIEPSKLSKDIFELEKDFRYNLFLLKVRDTEITRCKTHNEELLHDLHNKEQNIAQLHSVLREMETSLKVTNRNKHHMQTLLHNTIANLYSKLSDVTSAHEAYQRELRNKEKKREEASEKRFKEMVKNKEKVHQKEQAELNEKLQKETGLVTKLKAEIEAIIKENISLREQVQEQNSLNISKISILESELKSSKRDILDLEKKLEKNKNVYSYLEKELKRTISEKDQAKQKLSCSEEKNKEYEKKLNMISADKDDLKHQLKITRLELETCLSDLHHSEEINENLKTEIHYSQTEEQKCNIPEHDNFDKIKQQNVILQNVVKSMRKEKLDVVNTQEMEKKVDELENLVHFLKGSMLSKLLTNKVGAE